MIIPSLVLGDKEETDSVFLKEDGRIVLVLRYNLNELLELYQKVKE